MRYRIRRVFAVLLLASACEPAREDRPGPRQPSEKEVISPALRISWRGEDNPDPAKFSGSELPLELTIENQSARAVKDLHVACTQFGASGTAITTSTKTIYEVFAAGAKKRVRQFSGGYKDPQSKTMECRIVDFTLG